MTNEVDWEKLANLAKTKEEEARTLSLAALPSLGWEKVATVAAANAQALEANANSALPAISWKEAATHVQIKLSESKATAAAILNPAPAAEVVEQVVPEAQLVPEAAPSTQLISVTQPVPKVAPAIPVKEFNLPEMLEGAKVGGHLTLLKQGSKHHEAIAYAQNILVETGFLQTTDKNADNYINPKDFGAMDGNVTTNALNRLQKAMKDAGADIKVDANDSVRCYTETWTALAVAKHLHIKNGEVSGEAAQLLASNINHNYLNEIAFSSSVRGSVDEANSPTPIKPTNIATIAPVNNSLSLV